MSQKTNQKSNKQRSLEDIREQVIRDSLQNWPQVQQHQQEKQQSQYNKLFKQQSKYIKQLEEKIQQLQQPKFDFHDPYFNQYKSEYLQQQMFLSNQMEIKELNNEIQQLKMLILERESCNTSRNQESIHSNQLKQSNASTTYDQFAFNSREQVPQQQTFSFSQDNMFSFGESNQNMSPNTMSPRMSPTSSSLINICKQQVSENYSSDENEFQTLETLNLPIIYEQKTGLEQMRDFPILIGEKIAERYRIERHVASTSFTCVLQCTDLTNNSNVCVKMYQNSKDMLDQGLDEIKIMSIINQKAGNDFYRLHIVKLKSFFYYREHLFLIMEMLGENLFTLKQKSECQIFFQEQGLKSIAKQILIGLDFLHNIGIIHGDLKPENIVL